MDYSTFLKFNRTYISCSPQREAILSAHNLFGDRRFSVRIPQHKVVDAPPASLIKHKQALAHVIGCARQFWR
jgi:hypothetical protein